MKGCERQNVAKKWLTVDKLIEIPAKTLYGIQLVGFDRPFIQLQIIKHGTGYQISSPSLINFFSHCVNLTLEDDPPTNVCLLKMDASLKASV